MELVPKAPEVIALTMLKMNLTKKMAKEKYKNTVEACALRHLSLEPSAILFPEVKLSLVQEPPRIPTAKAVAAEKVKTQFKKSKETNMIGQAKAEMKLAIKAYNESKTIPKTAAKIAKLTLELEWS